MQKSKTVSELFTGANKKLTALRAKSDQRLRIREWVCAALPAKLARMVVSASIEQGRLSIGVTSAVWATRLRYMADNLRSRVGESTGIAVSSVRVRVVTSQGKTADPTMV
jgi:predicted nucleic acid-binding Zn ribbon protein